MDITAALPLRHLAVRDIAIRRPGATAVFRRFKIDYCCGGGASLTAAAQKRGVEVDKVIAALEAATPTSEPAPTETGALIDHLLERYHQSTVASSRRRSVWPLASRPCTATTPTAPPGCRNTWPSCSTTWRRTIRRRRWVSSR